jgi:predicted RNA-binding protein YlxR (DUF448 family)
MNPRMKAKPGGLPVRHVPQRTCVSCRKTGIKRELVRLVRVPEKGVEVDFTRKKSGRGAYLCPDRKCWENALKSGRLEQALKTSLKAEDKEALANYAKGFENIKQISS